MKARPFIEAAGTATLLLANEIWPLLSPYHLAVYHNPLSVSAIAWGLVIDLALESLLFVLVLVLLDRYSPKQAGFVWAAFLTLWIAKAVDFAVFFANFYHVYIHWTFSIRVGLMCVTLGAALLLLRFSSRVFQKSVRTARLGIAIFGCCIFWILPQLVFTAIRTHAPTENAFNKAVELPSPSRGRIVWILMDELSYDQVFDHRQADVQLPHFDELKKESVVFSDVQPEGYFTDRILPALFLGRRINNVRSSLRRNLYVHYAKTSQWERFNQNASLFGEAKQSGWNTGIAGWFNPYCHILQNVLDSCYWQTIMAFPGKLPGEMPSIADEATLPLDAPLAHFTTSASPTDLLVKAHTREYKDIMAAADSLVQNESIGFVFLHLPAPHPPGIYDRKTNTLGVAGSYLDNLALADKALENLLGVIQRTAAAARTTVIVSSDHSWRVGMWKQGNDSRWMAEEERASGGRFDPRPVLMIRFPGNDAGELRTERFPEIATHGIIEAMLKNEVRSKSDLDRWLSEYEETSGLNLAGNGH